MTTNNSNVKTVNNDNNDPSLLFEAKRNRPEGGYEIPAQVAEWMSDDSIEVMQHFGLQAPDLLNKYSNALEDALIRQTQRVKELEAALGELLEVVRGEESEEVTA